MSLSTDDEGPHSPQRVPGQPLQRSSSSFFGAIRSFVAAPLNWLNGEQVHDTGEKRSFPASVASDERATKKQRRLSPARESQPPSSPSFDEARDGISKLSFQQRNEHTPIPEPPPASLSRSSTVIMNTDAEASGSSFAHRSSQQWSSTNGPRSLSRDVSMGVLPSSQRRSVSRSSLIATPSSPYRMRQSLTPQPVLPPLSPNKRDNHASRASLMWPSASRASLSPLREFRREASAPAGRKQLIWDPTVGITTKDELHETSRANTPVPSTPAERALQALNSFRKPLVPPSFGNDPNAYTLLKRGRKYAPPPLPPGILATGIASKPINKERAILSGKSGRMIRPYDGEGGIKKLLKKRASEQQPDTRQEGFSRESGGQIERGISGLSRPSDTGNGNNDKGRELNTTMSHVGHDPSKKPLLSGRIAGSRSTAPARAVNPNAPGISSLRAEKISHRTHQPAARKNKFSIPDEDEEDEIEPHLQGLPTKRDLLKEKAVPFEIPSGFSFKFTTPQGSNAPSNAGTSTTPPNERMVGDTSSQSSASAAIAQPIVSDLPPTKKSESNAPSDGVTSSSVPVGLPEVHKQPVDKPTELPVNSFTLQPQVLAGASRIDQFKTSTVQENGKITSPPDFISFNAIPGESVSKVSTGPTTSLPFPLFSTAPTVNGSPASVRPFELKPSDTSPGSSITSTKPGVGNLPSPMTPVAPTSFSFGFPKPEQNTAQTRETASMPMPAPSIPETKPPPGSTEATKPPFSFTPLPETAISDTGVPVSDKPVASAPPFSFGMRTETANAPFSFGSTTGAIQSAATEHGKAPLSFGSSGSAPAPRQDEKGKPAFSFDSGPSIPTEPPLDNSKGTFSFGPGTSASAIQTFPFGSTKFAKAKTPDPVPSYDKMEESPSRGADVVKPAGFAFGSTLSNTTANQTTPTPFSFGGTTAVNSSTAAPFTFGNQNSSPFPTTADAPRPSTAGSTSGNPFVFGSNTTQSNPTTAPFAFGANSAPTSDNRASSPFNFGAPPSNPFSTTGGSTSNSFSSPLQTPQPLQNESRGTTPFSFNSPTLGPNPFHFGASKPSSPALGSTTLPGHPAPTAGPSTTPFQFGSGTQPAQPTQGETNLFTLGSAPPSTPQARAVKSLPKRRPAVRR